ncbi:MAG: hypothetical protein LBK55_08125, partial [Azoarcus sp.]|nr:hypothetical protein [Azoarcus sp.]
VRTDDLRLAKPPLSQLSYGPKPALQKPLSLSAARTVPEQNVRSNIFLNRLATTRRAVYHNQQGLHPIHAAFLRGVERHLCRWPAR